MQEVAKALIALDAVDVNKASATTAGTAPLHAACKVGDPAVVTSLIIAGADGALKCDDGSSAG